MKEDQCFLDPASLITSNRLDVAFRLAYLKLRMLNLPLAESYYYEIIKIQSLGRFIDPDNENRSRFQDYLDDFESLIESIEKNGFISSLSTIPLAADGSILNGSHRVAVALFFTQQVCVINKYSQPADCSANYLERFGMSNLLTETAVVDLLSYSNQFRVVVLWPSAENFAKSMKNTFKNIFYIKEIELSEIGKLNFLFEAYNHMNWIGSVSNNFRGIRQKVGECFPVNNSNKVMLLLINDEKDDVQKQKEQFRKSAGLGYSSIHSTDNVQESISLARIVLSESGLHFVNFSYNSRFNFREKAKSIKELLDQYGINAEHILFTGSVVLEAYGLRKSNDLDYFSLDDLTDYFGSPHDSQLKFYHSNKEDLIFSPDNFFWFEGVKIISLSALRRMKYKRSEKKDAHDIYLIDQVLDHRSRKDYLTGLKTQFYFAKVRIENNSYNIFISILNILRIKKIIKKIYFTLMRK